ncbi:unknown [Clostridium sp. CAG:768]|nr:unknown [Clostridium sp. CAG:768]
MAFELLPIPIASELDAFAIVPIAIVFVFCDLAPSPIAIEALPDAVVVPFDAA